jgi:RNA polymerase sigma-70 factor (ECF subfamily)
MDAEEFKASVLVHSVRMWRMAVTLLHDPEDANDAVQDAVARQSQPTSPLDQYGMEHEPQPGYDESQRLDDSESLGVVKMLLSRLPHDQQTVMRLSAFNGCSNDEIRQITGFSADNVRTLLSRARRRLKELFKAYQSCQKTVV